MSASPGSRTLSTTELVYLRNQSPVTGRWPGSNLVRSWVGPRARNLLVVSLLLSGTVGLQISAGAYRSEGNSYSDEAAHFMNARLYCDYVREGLKEKPYQLPTE